MNIAFVFPGQGSQHVGMAKDLWERSDKVKALYREASETLGYDVAELSFHGPEEELNKTYRTQPCIVAASVAALSGVAGSPIKPSAVAGHSLGEYSALVAAGVIAFSDALRLTEQRGRLMQDAVPEGKGLMAAIIGLERDKLDEICRSLESGYAAPANYNCPGQIVIAGERAAVEEAMRRCKEAGAKRALALAVSAPSHCTLMKDASDKLAALLDTITLKDAAVPLVNNADAILITNADGIKRSLIKQLNSPLLWEDSIRRLIGNGVDTFVEIGPGKVLTGLIKRIEPSAGLFNIEDTASLEKTMSALAAA